MLLSSFAYLLLFLPLVVLVYRQLRTRGLVTMAQWFLAASSLAFYAWTEPRSVPVLLISVLANWFLARQMMRLSGAARKRVFVAGLVLNVALLFGFKYLGFFTASLRAVGVPVPLITVAVFPLGLSFFTLQQVMYLVDCYEQLIVPNGFAAHASFVMFFPYLLLGPISRARSMVAQLVSTVPGRVQWESALTLLVLGLTKKVVFADSLARVVNAGYGSGAEWSTLEAWVFSVAYSLQLYFDFSGYSDMAMASARLLGMEIPQNFNIPFRSKTVTEFWQRWHMSLTGFITTYLFTPILRTMGKATPARAAVASVSSMLIAGLWHGPSWTFVIFGGLHGVALAVNQYWKRTKRKLPTWMPVLLTLCFVNAAFVVFRAPSVGIALQHLFSLLPVRGLEWAARGGSGLELTQSLGLIAVAGSFAFFGKDALALAQSDKPILGQRGFVLLLSVLCGVLITSSAETQFVYAQF
jgi:alginate O-acetyltransferase complex protein AlgI